jgi:hypothetical protein
MPIDGSQTLINPTPAINTPRQQRTSTSVEQPVPAAEGETVSRARSSGWKPKTLGALLAVTAAAGLVTVAAPQKAEAQVPCFPYQMHRAYPYQQFRVEHMRHGYWGMRGGVQIWINEAPRVYVEPQYSAWGYGCDGNYHHWDAPGHVYDQTGSYWMNYNTYTGACTWHY